jgi:hypothetical protein
VIGKAAGGCCGGPAVQVLFDELIDLRRTLGWKRPDELADRFAAT